MEIGVSAVGIERFSELAKQQSILREKLQRAEESNNQSAARKARFDLEQTQKGISKAMSRLSIMV